MNKNKIKEMQDKATRRRDGVFSMGPYSLIAVHNNSIVGFSEFIGPEEYGIYQLSHGFAVNIGQAKDKNQARNKLEYLVFNFEK